MAQSPIVYLFYGEDDYLLQERVNALLSKAGEPSMVEMNTTHLDGRQASLADLQNAAAAMPFLTKRRIVIVENAHELARTAGAREKLLAWLEQAPETAAIVLIVPQGLKENHPLLKWAQEHTDRCLVRGSGTPQNLPSWIMKRARAAGGEFTRPAAVLLATLVGGDTRLAAQEIEKLLAFVDYRRPVETEDVDLLTPSVTQGDIFKLVDAIGNQQPRQALGLLRTILTDRDPLSVFGMIVRQFRLMIQARAVLDSGGNDRVVAQQVGIHPFVAQKVSAQAQRFDLDTLKAVYDHLAIVDVAIKQGEVEPEAALETLVARLTLVRAG